MTNYDKTGIYVNLLNYCTIKELDGNSEFSSEKFKLYKEEIEEKTYLNSKGICLRFFTGMLLWQD